MSFEATTLAPAALTHNAPAEERAPQMMCSECKWVGRTEPRERKLAKYPHVYDIGIECPKCGHWTHSCFTSDSLKSDVDKLLAIREAQSHCDAAMLTRLTEMNRTATQAYTTRFLRFNRRFEQIMKITPLFTVKREPIQIEVDNAVLRGS